ncbi:MAG: hypothetical protein BroJett018_26720 [Chloroflexota bacterium]|nr:MAG: hypothetical protein BroJett018_26720 [Chloroflexota bacterium]
MLRPYETDIAANPVPFVDAISTNTGQASGPSPSIGRGVNALLKPFPLLGEGLGMGSVFSQM